MNIFDRVGMLFNFYANDQCSCLDNNQENKCQHRQNVSTLELWAIEDFWNLSFSTIVYLQNLR